MRLFVNIIGALVTLALSGWLGFHAYGWKQVDQSVLDVRTQVSRLESEIKLRAATGEVELTGRGWPVDADPAWFGGNVPDNELLPADRPWLEIANADDAHLMNPRVRISKDRETARFWYNPYQGVVRARVPYDLSDFAAVALYNRVNGTQIDTIFSTQEIMAATSEAAADEMAQVVPGQ